MAKIKKVKASKVSSKRSAVPEPPLPSLVEAMAKLVERLESLERKMDQVSGRVSNLPSDFRNAIANFQPGKNSHTSQNFLRPEPLQNQNHPADGRPERVMYKTVCADCYKNCEVPFKPAGRPVYCKECFAIRKAGHTPQDPERRVPVNAAKPVSFNTQGIETLPKNTTVFTKGTSKKKSAKPTAPKAKKKKR